MSETESARAARLSRELSELGVSVHVGERLEDATYTMTEALIAALRNVNELRELVLAEREQ